LPDVISKPIIKLKKNINAFKSAYDFSHAYRTSNMVDRLMQRMDKHLFNCKYFKGQFESARLGMRAWSLIQNFAYYNPLTIKKYNGISSPAEKINGKKYHEDWLQNLFISSSMAGYRSPPQNPI
jgi:coproporphyrinogen III oxidase-like Fe-S oxidoreductase